MRALRTITAVLIVVGLISSPALAGMWGPRQAGRVSVTGYENADYSGRKATYYGDTAWLPRGISSLRIQGDCTVTIFNNYNFQGRRQNVTSDVPNLEGSHVGNDRVLSLTISPGRGNGGGSGGGTTSPPSGAQSGTVLLYEHEDFGGRVMRLTGNISDMKKSSLGNDVVSSIKIENAEVTVYEHANFRGRSQTFTSSAPKLTQTRIGNDTISSIRVKWGQGTSGVGVQKTKPKQY